MNIEEIILQEWEKAGGEYALAARLVRKDLEKERARNYEEASC